jgi:hydroxymethylpyrimidine pyrophosphatase-like HAD family hydrolase/hypoxanthine phosphoribosyltransferase
VIAAQIQPPPETNLLLSFDELADRLLARLAGASAEADLLDCFLFAAGTNQVLEDYLQRHVFYLGNAAKHLGPLIPGVGPFAAKAAANANRIGFRARARLPHETRLARRGRELARLVEHLATELVARALAEDPSDGAGESSRLVTARAQAGGLFVPREQFPDELRRTILRLPNCFRSFDQQPEDCRRLVERFSGRWPDRRRPLVVVGLRTSGNYLAPLISSFLVATGYERVAETLTIRPGRLLDARSLHVLGKVVAAGGLVLVVDDPPRTGAQLTQALDELQAVGMPSASLVIVLQLFGSVDSLPRSLSPFDAVLMPWEEWSIHEHLTPEALERALGELVQRPVQVESVTERPGERGHARAVVSARIGNDSRSTKAESICVEGVGLGYFGRHSLSVADALPDSFPPVYGLRQGLLFRGWLSEETRVSPASLAEEADAVAGQIATYVQLRNRALPLDEDVSLRIAGRDAAWELGGDMLGQAFGRSRQAVRPLTHAAARRLFQVDRPSVLDGATEPWNWFADADADGDRFIKVGVDTRAFSNEGILSCDPILDLARAATAAEAAGVVEADARLREHYEADAGNPFGDERWLLYRLAHHLDDYRSLLRQVAAEPRSADDTFARLLALERTMASIHRRYLADLFLSDLVPQSAGPLCAIDIDGVLETRWLSFPALAPAGAQALRTLNRHGYRVILITGRSLSEVGERCAAYRLTGGVAEYGAALHDELSGNESSLLAEADRAALAALERALRERPGVYLDPAYLHSVRAHTLNAAGQRTALEPDAIEAALAAPAVDGRLRVVQGDLQTDFVSSSVDKGAGVRALIRELGGNDDYHPLLALGVGDTASDLPFLALAKRAVAPANAAAELRGKVQILRRSYQSGLLDAVSGLVGHGPAGCDLCRPPHPPSRDTKLFLTALAALNGGKLGKVRQAVALAVLLVQ